MMFGCLQYYTEVKSGPSEKQNMLLFLPLKLFDFDNIKFHISYQAQPAAGSLIDQNIIQTCSNVTI